MKKILALCFATLFLISCSSKNEDEDLLVSSEYLVSNPSIALNGTTEVLLPITTDRQWSIAIDNGGETDNWIVVSRTSGTGTSEVTVKAATRNPHPDRQREGKLTLSSERGEVNRIISVFQYSGDETFSVGSSDIIPVGNRGETIPVTVTCNTSWQVVGGQAWCKITKNSEKLATIDVAANPDELERTAVFTFTSQRNDIVKVTVIQSPTYADLYCIASPENSAVSEDGGDVEIEVLSSVDWRMSVSDSWLKFVNGGSLESTITGAELKPTRTRVIWADTESTENLLNSGTLSLASCWWADSNWGQIVSPEVVIDGKNVTISAVEANGGSQWQGQVHLNTHVAIEEGKAYDFTITLNASQELGGVTVKPHPESDDGHFFSEGRHDIAAFEDVKVTYENVIADFSTGNLLITFDFPGCESGTIINVKDIIIQEHNGLPIQTITLRAAANDDTVVRTATITLNYSIRGVDYTSTCKVTQEPGKSPDPWDNKTPE